MTLLKQLRLSRKLTQAAIADMLHVTPQAIRNYEHGRRTCPMAYYELLILKLDSSPGFRQLVKSKLK